jgi:predicted nucleic acid-binding Zn ribbon protein
VQSFSDNSLTSCPECQGTLRKKFYRTDSRDTKGSTVSPAPAAPAATPAPAAAAS